MDQQSKQGQSQGHGKRKKDEDTAANGGNGASMTNDFPEELAEQGAGGLSRPKITRSKRASTPGRSLSLRARRVGAASRAGARLQEGRALERLHRGDEGRRREGQVGNAHGQDPGAARDDRGLSRSSQARCDGCQRVQPDPEHPARQLRSGRCAGSAVRDDEALAGSDRAAAQEGVGRRGGRGQGGACTCASRTCSSRSSRTRPRRSRPSSRSWRSIPTTARPSASSSRCTRSAATGRS